MDIQDLFSSLPANKVPFRWCVDRNNPEALSSFDFYTHLTEAEEWNIRRAAAINGVHLHFDIDGYGHIYIKNRVLDGIKETAQATA